MVHYSFMKTYKFDVPCEWIVRWLKMNDLVSNSFSDTTDTCWSYFENWWSLYPQMTREDVKKKKKKTDHWLDWLQTAEFFFSAIFSSLKSFKDPHLNFWLDIPFGTSRALSPIMKILCGFVFFFNFQNVPTSDVVSDHLNVPLKRTDWLPAVFFFFSFSSKAINQREKKGLNIPSYNHIHNFCAIWDYFSYIMLIHFFLRSFSCRHLLTFISSNSY